MEFNSQDASEINHERFDRLKALKEFDDTKAGVKGLVDAGITSLPQIFHTPMEELSPIPQTISTVDFHVPTIDLRAVNTEPLLRNRAVEAIKLACETWGFFQVTNHSVAQETMDQILEGVRGFHEQPNEIKAEFYSRDMTRKVRLNTNFNLFRSKSASWRDTLFCSMTPEPPQPQELPQSCRELMIRYTDEVKKLGGSLFELISEALRLEPSHLKGMGCLEGQFLVCHYYPACPEPDRTLGHARHTDPDFLTVLLQDRTGGLQVLHQNRWIEVPPIEGALIVNVGDLLQLISNDAFKSVEHRVAVNSTTTRVSVACFFSTHLQSSERVFAPIEELARPAVFRGTSVKDFINSFPTLPVGISALQLLRL